MPITKTEASSCKLQPAVIGTSWKRFGWPLKDMLFHYLLVIELRCT